MNVIYLLIPKLKSNRENISDVHNVTMGSYCHVGYGVQVDIVEQVASPLCMVETPTSGPLTFTVISTPISSYILSFFR